LSLLMVTALILALFVSLAVVPPTYSWTTTCSACNGMGTVTCSECRGSGKCIWCGGTGHLSFPPPYDDWCAACQGTGICHVCGGSGKQVCLACGGSGNIFHWMFTSVGSTVSLSLFSIFLFLGFFGLSIVCSAFYLSFNEWVYDVEDMDFLFNPSFMTWLYAKDRRRWTKWQLPACLILGICLGSTLFAEAYPTNLTSDMLLTAIILTVPITFAFSFLSYKAYTSRLEPATR
jgi:hypothetical protein